MAEPGWYDDPLGEHPQRWWDGITWTEQVRDPVAVPAAEHTSGAASAAPLQPQPEPTDSPEATDRSDGPPDQPYETPAPTDSGQVAAEPLPDWARFTAPGIDALAPESPTPVPEPEQATRRERRARRSRRPAGVPVDGARRFEPAGFLEAVQSKFWSVLVVTVIGGAIAAALLAGGVLLAAEWSNITVEVEDGFAYLSADFDTSSTVAVWVGQVLAGLVVQVTFLSVFSLVAASSSIAFWSVIDAVQVGARATARLVAALVGLGVVFGGMAVLLALLTEEIAWAGWAFLPFGAVAFAVYVLALAWATVWCVQETMRRCQTV